MPERENADPRARILAVADQLFYSEGIRATGTDKIIAMSDVAKATFYRHFESKDVLVLAYLERQNESFWTHMSTPNPPASLREALTRIESLVNHPAVGSCPFLRIASEYPDPEHAFHRSVRDHKEKLLEYLGQFLSAERNNRREVAAQLLTLIDGAFSVRLVFGTTRHVPLLTYAEPIIKATEEL